MYEIEVITGFKKVEGKDDKPIKLIVEIREPDFEEFNGALMAMEKPSGAISKADGGKFILETCSVSGLEPLKKNARAYVGACFDVYNEILFFYKSTIKKK